MRKKSVSQKNKKTSKKINFKAILQFVGIAFFSFLLVAIVGIYKFAAVITPSPEKSDETNQSTSLLIDNLKAKDLTGEYNSDENRAEYNGKNISVPLADNDKQTNSKKKISQVLGESTSSKTGEAIEKDYKRIEVDLTNQRLYAFEGDNKVYDFLISSGKWGKTPTGNFRIWGKFRYTKMSGGSKENRTYYYLPNVPFVMFFSGDGIAASRGFGIHGTYWHENFGTPMSHGCINMRTEEAELIYNWSDPNTGDKKSIRAEKDNTGTQVVIYGVAPKE